MKLVHYDVILEVLTPLHIGTGQELYPEADFVVEQGPGGVRMVRVIDVDAALLTMSPAEIAAIRDGRVAAAISKRHTQQHTRALLPVRGPGNLTRTRALQRLPDGRPFIPGTTVKGSIRTALLQALAAPQAIDQLPSAGGSDPGRAASRIEEATFGLALDAQSEREVQFANRDLNRAVRVSDLVPQGQAPVAVVNMSAYRVAEAPGRRTAPPIPIWCEAIEPGARFQGVISIETDSPVWQAMSAPQRSAVEGLFARWYDWGRRLLEAERSAWASGPRDVRQSVLQFIEGRLKAREVCVNLGWGGGWRSKTLGTLIPRDSLLAIAQQYDLRRWQGRDFPDRFPVTRKVAYARNGPLPPGWVRVLRRQQEGNE